MGKGKGNGGWGRGKGVDLIQLGNGGGGMGRKTVAVGGQRSCSQGSVARIEGSFGKEEGFNELFEFPLA